MSNSSVCPPASISPLGVDISSSIDAVYYGFVLATVFLGVTIVQGWVYLRTNEDKWPLRTLIASIILMDLSTTVLQSQGIHHYLIANFGNLEALMVFSQILNTEFALTTVVKLIVEVFFASCVLKLHHPRNYVVPGLIVITAIGALVAGFVTFVAQVQDTSVNSLGLRSRKIEASLHDAFAAVSNIIATVALSISFFKSRTGIKRTDSIIETLFLFVVSRGVLLSVAQLVTLILYVIYPEKLYWLALCLCHSKLYAITMLAMLNTRTGLRARLVASVVTDSSFIGALGSRDEAKLSLSRQANPTATTIEWDESLKSEDGCSQGLDKGAAVITVTQERLVSSDV